MGNRLAFLGKLKPGKYFQMFNGRPKLPTDFTKEDLSPYVLSMLSLGCTAEDIYRNKTAEAKATLEKTISLLKDYKVIECEGSSWRIINNIPIESNVSPFLARILL